MTSKTLVVSVLAGIALCTTGCATKPVNMTAGAVTAASASQMQNLQNSIAVADVQGGKKTTLVTAVSNEDFLQALRESLANNGLLAATGGDYTLTAELMRIKKPKLGGFNLKVTSEVRYVLSDAISGDVLMDELVETNHTSKFNEAYFADKRLRIAAEGAIRANIANFIERLAAQMGDAADTPNDGIKISFRLGAGPA